MTIANLVVAELSPVAGTMATAATPLSICFGNHWFAAATGAPVSAPTSSSAITDACDNTRPQSPSEVKADWARALEGKVAYVTRVMTAKPGGVALVRTSRDPRDAADLWWCHGKEARLARRSLPTTSAVELLADGVGVLLDRANRRLERFHADRADVFEIALPGIVEPAEFRGRSRLFAALRDSDALVIGGDKRCYWMRIAELVRDLGTTVTWKIAWTFPGADPSARREGVVTMCKYGVTNVEFPDGKKQFSGDFRVQVGDRIALVGKLWEALGSVQYREIERPDGSRMPMPGAPPMIAEQTSAVVHHASAPAPVKRKRPVKLTKQVAALREAGLFGDMTDAVLAEYCELETPEIVELILAYYELHSDRAARDRYLAHDWRFGQETDDVIAELSGLLGTPPLFVQLENGADGIVVRGPDGDETIEVDGLHDVVAHFNHALARGTSFGDVRIYALETEDERHAYFALAKSAMERLTATGIPLYEP